MTEHDLPAVARRFSLAGSPERITPYGSGHINDTYLVSCDTGRQYILQRINHHVFKKPPELMENIRRVTAHLRTKITAEAGDPDRECLTVIPTRAGDSFYRDAAGNFWRTYLFVTDAAGYDLVDSPDLARAMGRAYGRFQSLLADLPGPRLHETIPGFHDLPARLKVFNGILRHDPAGRAAEVKMEAGFIRDHADRLLAIHTLGTQNKIPLRITHNDTKSNNVLLHRLGKDACVIDLDTVMNGYVHFDFGDAVRTITNTAAEDEKDTGKVAMDPALFRGFTDGYLEHAADFLSDTERRHLPLAGPMMTFMIGLRFLTDYLDGDKYFKIRYPDQNLVRARAQFALVRSMLEQMDEMEKAFSL